jgi:hypothetical protein
MNPAKRKKLFRMQLAKENSASVEQPVVAEKTEMKLGLQEMPKPVEQVVAVEETSTEPVVTVAVPVDTRKKKKV